MQRRGLPTQMSSVLAPIQTVQLWRVRDDLNASMKIRLHDEPHSSFRKFQQKTKADTDANR